MGSEVKEADYCSEASATGRPTVSAAAAGSAAAGEAKDDAAREAARVARRRPTTGRMLSYSHLRMLLSAMDLTVRPARGLVYVEALNMSPSAQAMAISASKAADIVLGFLVGKASDSLRTRWGRRKPFIAICFPICIFCMIMFTAFPTYIFGGTNDKPSAPSFAENLSCDNLKAGVTSSIAAGSLLPWDNTGDFPSKTYAGAGLTAYFAFFYFFYYVFGWTGTNIPYDALGMELTDEFTERTKLFGIKTAMQFVGYTIPIILQMGLNMSMSSDVSFQYTIMAIVIGIWGLIGTLNLCCSVGERPPAPVGLKKEGEIEVPFVPSARRVFGNRPYLMYLAMRVPMTLCSLMPSNLLGYYVKSVMAEENVVGEQTICSGITLLAAVGCIPIFVAVSKRFHRKDVLAVILAIEGVALIVAGLIPGSVMVRYKPVLYFIMMVVGASLSAGFVLPDAMLADIIDYDELLSGARNEGMYTVIETNLQQLVEVLGGVLPLVVFQAAGYESNGGCLCGCGVDCDKEMGLKYARWYCPNDIGYSCTNAIGSPLFLGDLSRPAPCTVQNDSVSMAIRFFFTVLPGILSLVAVLPAWRMSITAKMHKDIIAELAKREANPDYVCTDPVTGKAVQLPSNTEEALFVEHFSKSEKTWAAQAGNWLQRMKMLIGAQLGVTGAAFAVLLAGVIMAHNENVITFACMGFAVIFVALPWNVVRYRALAARQPTEVAQQS